MVKIQSALYHPKRESNGAWKREIDTKSGKIQGEGKPVNVAGNALKGPRFYEYNSAAYTTFIVSTVFLNYT